MNPISTRSVPGGQRFSLPAWRADGATANGREAIGSSAQSGSVSSQADAFESWGGPGKQCFLWIDLTRGKNGSDLFARASRSYRAVRLRAVQAIPAAVFATSPLFLCFEFDRCGPTDLRALRDTRLQHPALPILMLAEGCSEQLTALAFRMGAWEYLAKPVPFHELESRIATLVARCRTNRLEGAPANPEPDLLPARGQPDAPAERPARDPRTEPAVSYIAANFQDKVSLDATARTCHLSPSQFSRVFKQEHGVTFCRYLLHYRIVKACELLAGTPAPVKQVCFAVGFNDHSYFSRMFRRFVGVRPTEYPVGLRER